MKTSLVGIKVNYSHGMQSDLQFKHLKRHSERSDSCMTGTKWLLRELNLGTSGDVTAFLTATTPCLQLWICINSTFRRQPAFSQAATLLTQLTWIISMIKQEHLHSLFDSAVNEWSCCIQEGPNLMQKPRLLTFKSISRCGGGRGSPSVPTNTRWTFNTDVAALKNANTIRPSWKVYRKNQRQQWSI